MSKTKNELSFTCNECRKLADSNYWLLRYTTYAADFVRLQELYKYRIEAHKFNLVKQLFLLQFLINLLFLIASS